jgi:VWFA-related protein
MSAKRPIYFLLLSALLVGSPRCFCSQQKNKPSPTALSKEADTNELLFKSVVNRVILDVVVTDSNGKPVHGLTQQDFSVSEDGQSQRILSFDVHSLGTSQELPNQTLGSDTSIKAQSTPERDPLYVLLLDLVNTEPDDQAPARQQLVAFIKGKPQGTRFAIFVLSDGLYLVQNFTDDQKQLSMVLDPTHPIPHLPRVFIDGQNKQW